MTGDGNRSPRLDAGSGAGPGRVVELDAMRGLAAVAVVVYHARIDVMPWGWAAVDLFFVLSGYLITAIILRDGGAPGFLWTFYVRRGLRVWPAYYVTLALLVAFAPCVPRHVDWKGLPFALTFAQGVQVYAARAVHIFSAYLEHTWTLAIEEQFYLFWPALVLLVGRRRVAPLALALAAGSVYVRGRGFSPMLLAGRGEGLALGGLLAALLARHAPDGNVPGALRVVFGGIAVPSFAALLVLAPHVFTKTHLVILALNLLFFALIGLVVSYRGRPVLAFLRLAPLRALGQISYGVYLYHYGILLLTADMAARHGWPVDSRARQALGVALGFAVAGVSWFALEQPALRLKHRFAYRPPRAGSPVPRPSARPAMWGSARRRSSESSSAR